MSWTCPQCGEAFKRQGRHVGRCKPDRATNCASCGKPLVRHKQSVYCSQACMGKGYSYDAEDFWKLVNKASPGGCWLYEGTISFEGYGYVNRGSGPRRKQYQAHRYAWEILLGKPLPRDKCLLHHCDIRNCVNPDHLYLGTRKDNIQDAIRRGRYNHRYTPVEKLLWPHLSRKVKP